MRRKFYIFSGIDGAGKSTQIHLFCQQLQSLNYPTKKIWIRIGYTPLIHFLKVCLRRTGTGMLPKPGISEKRDRMFSYRIVRHVWIIVSMLDLFVYLSIWLRFVRAFGFNVIADRWIEDSELDLEINFEVDKPTTWMLWKIIKILSPKPSMHFIFLIPVQESIKRSKVKNEPFPDSEEVLVRRLKRYDTLSSKGGIYKINGLMPKEVLFKKILEICEVIS